ncbi:unnamed protein product [Didymodactylos carnosus]|uniref:Uncharacterized protein n=1 Tax=Didymodactylos carnosus TaxID=1234261 RepID=A0A814GUJ4_9BILA|nr:unnamed protein product [Didymodactylos carnosus]CAF1000915.1 unnamed protein product [Didymodactylos carnosus]CAF3750768.1 unnamed protein product [Didymodactylos carnosus]CAF3772378.1 unnamed protein product [Didymodactylos carnosus]
MTRYLRSEETDEETLILMNDINKIKDLVPKYKHQLLFICEHEKLFKTVVLGISGRHNEAVTTMNMDEHVSNEPLCDRNVPSSSTENIPPSKSMQKKFPETYEVPDLPENIQNFIDKGQLEGFANHCGHRHVLTDIVFHDLTTNFGLWYPDRRQYEAVSFAILKKLKKIWKETIQAKFKRQRRPLADINPDIKQMKEKFSRPDNGRPIKKKTMILAERDQEKKVLIQSSNTDDEGEQEKRVQVMNDELEKSDTDWRNDQLPIGIIKVIARTFDESWHHTIRVGEEEPTTPYPTLKLEENQIKTFLDWQTVTETDSINDAVAILVSFYRLFELKFSTHCRAIRLLYIVLLNEKKYFSNSIRRVLIDCKFDFGQEKKALLIEKINTTTEKDEEDKGDGSNDSSLEDDNEQKEDPITTSTGSSQTKQKRSRDESNDENKAMQEVLEPIRQKAKIITITKRKILSTTINQQCLKRCRGENGHPKLNFKAEEQEIEESMHVQTQHSTRATKRNVRQKKMR